MRTKREKVTLNKIKPALPRERQKKKTRETKLKNM